jgi:hypothetical protein
MKLFHRYLGPWNVFVVICSLLTGCATTLKRVTIPAPQNDAPPRITVRAIPFLPPNTPGSAGDIQKSILATPPASSVSNVDQGTFAQLSANADNDGGVQSLTMSITENGVPPFQGIAQGSKDGNGQVPNSLVVSQTNTGAAVTFQINSVLTLTSQASNFNNESTSLAVTYVPLAPSQRKKDISKLLILPQVLGLNTYQITLPDPNGPPVDGFLHYLNGGNQDIFLMVAGKSTTQCGDLAVSTSLLANHNLLAGDLTKLYGSETPGFPRTIVACSNPNNPLPDHLEVWATYQFN